MSFSDTPIQYDDEGNIKITRPINWNKFEDAVDLEVWDKLTSNFWLPEKTPLANDVSNWHKLTPDEKECFNKNFAFLTTLDTVQGFIGAPALMRDAVTMHEESVLLNIGFMERFVEGTEVLTPNGWVPIKEITTKDKVVQYDPHNTEQLSFVNPTRIYAPELRDGYIRFSGENGRGAQVVSRGHRVFFQRQLEDGAWVSEVATASEFISLINDPEIRLRVPLTGLNAKYQGVEMSPQELLMMALNLLVFHNEGDEYSVILRPNRAEIFKDILSSNNIKYSASDKDCNVEISFSSTEVIEGIFRGSIKERVSLDKTSTLWFQDALDMATAFVGQTTEDDKSYLRLTDEDMADFLMTAASMSGYEHSLSSYGEGDYLLSWSRYGSPWMYKEEISYHEYPFAVQTYCIQVPSTYLLTRYRAAGELFSGSTVVTGNCVHAKSYSSINATFLSTQEIEDAWRWAEQSEHVRYTIERITQFYHGKDPLRKKAASTALESFLFYSGFYLPLRYNRQLPQVADLIRLIIRDEAVHGYYIGYKFQRGVQALSVDEQRELKDDVYALVFDLYENHVKLAHELYDPLGYTEDVKAFLHFNANKALMNLGYDPMFPEELTQVSETVRGALALSSENHDFFSGAGSSYTMLKAESISDDDLEGMFD